MSWRWRSRAGGAFVGAAGSWPSAPPVHVARSGAGYVPSPGEYQAIFRRSCLVARGACMARLYAGDGATARHAARRNRRRRARVVVLPAIFAGGTSRRRRPVSASARSAVVRRASVGIGRNDVQTARSGAPPRPLPSWRAYPPASDRGFSIGSAAIRLVPAPRSCMDSTAGHGAQCRSRSTGRRTVRGDPRRPARDPHRPRRRWRRCRRRRWRVVRRRRSCDRMSADGSRADRARP